MKTVLPAEIKTIDEADQFLYALHVNNEEFHPEDDATNVHWGQGKEPSKEDQLQLNKLMNDIYSLEGDYDPCEALLWFQKYETIKHEYEVSQNTDRKNVIITVQDGTVTNVATSFAKLGVCILDLDIPNNGGDIDTGIYEPDQILNSRDEVDSFISSTVDKYARETEKG